MMERLADLDELILRCRTEQSKSYLSEAVAAYRAGAYRASIASTWIAVVFDVIDKIRELALSGSGKAKVLRSDIDKNQAQMDKGDRVAIDAALQFEREVLEIARDRLELIDQQQFIDLQRLREDRNRCAHPTYQRIEIPYRPSAELARTHIYNAVAHLLSQLPVQGKAALAELEALVISKLFPADVAKARTQLSESALSRPSESLFRGFIDLLVYGLFDKGGKLRARLSTLAALQACLEIDRSQAEGRICKNLNKIAKTVPDDDVATLVVAACKLDGIWSLLEQSLRDKVVQFVTTGDETQAVRAIPYALQTPDLKASIAKRIEGLPRASLASLIAKGVQDECVERAVELYCTAGSWNDANFVAEQVIQPLVPKLSRDHIERIVKSPMHEGSDLRGSGGFPVFLSAIVEKGRISRDSLNELLAANHLESYVLSDGSQSSNGDIPF